jgi:hypothetical protein
MEEEEGWGNKEPTKNNVDQEDMFDSDSDWDDNDDDNSGGHMMPVPDL